MIGLAFQAGHQFIYLLTFRNNKFALNKFWNQINIDDALFEFFLLTSNEQHITMITKRNNYIKRQENNTYFS